MKRLKEVQLPEWTRVMWGSLDIRNEWEPKIETYKEAFENLEIDSVNLTTQREFLLKMGILERAEIISKNMPFSKKSDTYLRLKRLIDKKQMGTLFKVLFATNKKNNFNLGF